MLRGIVMFPRAISKSRSWPLNRWQWRRFSNGGYPGASEIPPVKYLRPVIWSTATILFIYYSAAQVETFRDRLRNGLNSKDGRPPSKRMSFEQVEAERQYRFRGELQRRKDADVSIWALTSVEAVEATWNSLTTVEKAVWTATGINTTLFLSGRLYPPLTTSFYHLPILNRNWTLLTSAFGHGGPLHLLANMYVLNNFALPVARSRTFQGSALHMSAFYLSSGILSCLAYHLQSAVKMSYRYTPCLGASGAIYAMIGVFGMSYPDAQIGIIFLPFAFPVQQALSVVAAFELYGTVIGTRLGLAHISHLAGLATGVGYVYFDAGTKVWRDMKRHIYRNMDAIATKESGRSAR